MPGSGRDKQEAILCLTHDRVFGTCRAVCSKRIGQSDPSGPGQPVAGEPVEECRRAGSVHHVLGERGGIDQADAFPDRLGFVDRMLPPRAPSEAAGVAVETARSVPRSVVVRTFPAVDLAELRARRLLPIICRRGAKRPARFAFFIRVMQDVDMRIALLVLSHRVFRGHPRAVPLRIEACHVDFGLAFDHKLRKVVTCAARRGDAKGEALGKPHVAKPWRGPKQGIAVRRVADRAIEVVLEANGFR